MARTATRRVASPLLQSAKRLPRIHAIAPWVRTGAGRGAMGWKMAAIASALLDGRAAVAPAHEGESRERRREEYRHDDGDALHRAAGVVERRVGDRYDVRVADRHRERRILGEVQVLAGHRGNDDAQG